MQPLMLTSLLTSLVACFLACRSEPVVFDSPDQCRALSAGPQRDECWAAVAPDLFREDSVAAEAIVMEQVSDSKIRDFIWLTVTREVDPGSYRWCEKIQEEALGSRCRTLVSRPHLHRALQQDRGEAPGRPGGGPPPPGGSGGQGVRRGPPPGQAPPGQAPPGQAPPGQATPSADVAPDDSTP